MTASHLIAYPGADRTGCGERRADHAVTWIRWMGAHETGRMFVGRPLPAWCPACIYALHPAPTTPQGALF